MKIHLHLPLPMCWLPPPPPHPCSPYCSPLVPAPGTSWRGCVHCVPAPCGGLAGRPGVHLSLRTPPRHRGLQCRGGPEGVPGLVRAACPLPPPPSPCWVGARCCTVGANGTCSIPQVACRSSLSSSMTRAHPHLPPPPPPLRLLVSGNVCPCP
jgi:hypothetical protein